MWLTDDGNIDYEPDPPTPASAPRALAPVCRPMQLILDQLTSHDGNGMIYAPFFNYSYGDLVDDLRGHAASVHAQWGSATPAHTAAPSATVACPRSCSPTGPAIAPVVRGCRSSTSCTARPSQTAALYGLADRGVVAPGMRADLNLIDYERLSFGPARMAFDLPAGGRRLVQKASGYVGTWCAGVQTVDDDEFTGELPGVLLRAGN